MNESQAEAADQFQFKHDLAASNLTYTVGTGGGLNLPRSFAHSGTKHHRTGRCLRPVSPGIKVDGIESALIVWKRILEEISSISPATTTNGRADAANRLVAQNSRMT